MVRVVKLVIRLLFIVCLALGVGVLFVKPPLPDYTQRAFVRDPHQSGAINQTLQKTFENLRYQIEQVGYYEISGVVVEQYTSNNIFDISHKNDPLNTRDLCIVWGSNLKNDVYRKLKYSHGEFTCFYEWWGKLDQTFNPSEFSNSHLIPANEEVAQKLNTIKVGDFVTIKGKLSNYTVDRAGEYLVKRSTSMVRTDSGNGACEIIYVTDVNVTPDHNSMYFAIRDFALILAAAFGVISLVLFGF